MRVAANKGLKCSARITLTSQGPLLIEERSGPAVTRAQVGGAEPGRTGTGHRRTPPSLLPPLPTRLGHAQHSALSGGTFPAESAAARRCKRSFATSRLPYLAATCKGVKPF